MTNLGTVGDVDDVDGDVDITVVVTNGHFEERKPATAPVTVTTFTLAAVLADEIYFVHDGNGLAPSFSVSASDGSLDSGTPVDATIDFTIPNTAPVAGDDTIIADGSFTLDSNWLLTNDSDADGDTLSVSSVDNPVGGTVDLVDGVVSYSLTSLAYKLVRLCRQRWHRQRHRDRQCHD